MNKAPRRIQIRKHLTYANVMVTLLSVIVLGGATAYAALKIPRNSIGTRQLQAKSVTNGKLASGAVSGAKIAEGTITGQNVNLNALGSVPQATNAGHAANADTLGSEHHAASCPAHTTLIRGLCYDTSATEAPNLKAAAEACAAKGGYLPSPMQLYSTKAVLNLGDGVGTEKRFTDDVYSKVGEGKYSTIVIDGAGAVEEQEITQPASYMCVYPLVR
jgi:hypothetical protein